MKKFLDPRETRGLYLRLSGATTSLFRFYGHANKDTSRHNTSNSNSSSQQEQQKPKATESATDFHRFADIYLGGLWNRFECELRKTEGDNFEYEVQVSSGCMHVLLPGDAKIVICKDAQEQALCIESNLHSITGEAPEPRDSAMFALMDDGEFKQGDVPLHEYLEDHLAKHLNVQGLDLEPQRGANDAVYGPDPT